MCGSRRTRRRGKEITASLTTQQATTTATISIRHPFGGGGVPDDGPPSSPSALLSRLLQDSCYKNAYMRLALWRRGVRLNRPTYQQYRAFLLARAADAWSSTAPSEIPSSAASSALTRWPPFPLQSCRRGLRVEPQREADKVILAAMRARGDAGGVRSGEVAAESTC